MIGGFEVIIPINYVDFSVPEAVLTSLVQNGWYDEKTSSLEIDFAVYNSVDNMISYLNFQFEISPATRMSRKELILRTFRATPYADHGGATLGFFSVLFFILFVYYFFQEFVKVYNQLKKALNQRLTNIDKQQNAAAAAA